jgi:WD40 repeat protein
MYFTAAADVVPIKTTEIYDPTTGKFSPGGSMSAVRWAHTATLLPDGRVLLAGGIGTAYADLSSAEIYDPTTAKFTSTGSMASARGDFTATLLGNGEVLVAGGAVGPSAELYDPAKGRFIATGSMKVERHAHTATMLPDGRVLLAGGESTCDASGCAPISSAELYDPKTGTFILTDSMSFARWGHISVLLSDGRVLIAAGGANQKYLSSAEVYDPATGMFASSGPLSHGRSSATGTLLPDGTVLVAGGWDGTAESDLGELYS